MRRKRSTWRNTCMAIGLSLALLIFCRSDVSSTVHLSSTQSPSGVTAGVPLPGETSGFVTRSGTRLMLNGQPFRFAGANTHWLALDDTTNYPSQFRVNDALDTARAMGLTVIRSHSLGISTGCPNCNESSPGIFNEKALDHADYVIQAAAARGLRLIIPLTDNWRYPAGGKHNFTDWRGISDEDQFYYNPQVISDFEAYIHTLLNHMNSYTGIAYKDDPAIMAWETGNELQPPTSWTQMISTYIKSIDPHHLVIDGRAGIDPNAASLKNVDILSDHYYPKNVAKMEADAQAAAKAGKSFVVGEFDWNDANGGDRLNSFLASILANPEVAGDAFWELWSHDDQYGYDSNDPQYTLHYPGDTAAMRDGVELLQSYAYRMSGLSAPAGRVPGTPLLETVIRNGTTNTLIWRGAAVAASYTIQRSTTGPRGPWSIVCNRCATDNDTPWVDTHVPAGTLWYRLIAYSASGAAGAPSNAYQAGSDGLIIDNLDDWSHTYQHSGGLVFDSTYAQYMRGDTSRAVRTTATHEHITWKQVGMTSFQTIAYFWPSEPVSHLTFDVSADGRDWTAVTPGIVNVRGNWQEYVYTLPGLSGANYIRVVWNNIAGHAWNPNLGSVSILYSSTTAAVK